MPYDNLFHQLLARLREDAGWMLQLIHDTRGIVAEDLPGALALSQVCNTDSCLRELEALDLVVRPEGQ